MGQKNVRDALGIIWGTAVPYSKVSSQVKAKAKTDRRTEDDGSAVE
jgi:hypothetical protein